MSAPRISTGPSPAESEAEAEAGMAHQVPDAFGRFGAFGGRFVPETLMDALNQMAEAYDEARRDPAFLARLDGLLADYVGRPSPLFLAERLTEHGRRGGDLPEARGPEPHRRPQDQQRPGPGPDRPADGQDPGDRRDRRRAARGGHGHGLRPVRPGMHRLHGRGGHPPPEAQRLQHEDDGRDGRPRDLRLADPPRRHQRGDARLDGRRRGRRTTPSAAWSARTRSR